MITEKEFQEVFGLVDSCKVPKRTLNQYYKQIKGAYLLYLEVLNIGNKKFKNVDNTPLSAHFDAFRGGFQHFVYALGSKSHFNVSYFDKKNDRTTPFWTYTKYEDNEIEDIKNAAYNIFKSTILTKLKLKYMKYGISFSYRDYATTERNHPNNSIWWDGVTFTPLFFKTKKSFIELDSDDIVQTIKNRTDIWDGDILDPVRKIMDEIDKKQNESINV